MKKSAIFGVRNLAHYDAGNIMTWAGLAISLIGGAVALAGRCLEANSFSEKVPVFPDEDAVALVNYAFDNFKEEESE